jgi:hypothetical protein
MTNTDDEGWTEVSGASIHRMDLVDKSANGAPFLLMKSAAGDPGSGFVTPDQVRSLIGDGGASALADKLARVESRVTNIGALMKTIHEAAVRDAQTAPEEPAVADTMTKDAGMDASTIEGDPGSGVPTGGESVPGSPAWEALDAATAGKWVAILGRAKNALAWLATRERTEGIDGNAAFDLDDAGSAIDYAISTLAGFAAGEQLEVDTAQDGLALVTKAANDADGPLAVIESLSPLAKAGRTLSAANESAIRAAVDSLSKVLASLPAAPVDAVTKKEATVAGSTDNAPTEPSPELLAEINKAKGDPLTPVYDQEGKLVGMVDVGNLIPIAPAAAPEPEKPKPEAAPEVPAPADAAPAPDAPAAVTVPGTGTIQSPPVPEDVAKAVATQISAALEEVLSAKTKERGETAELVKAVHDLQERVAKMGGMPDDRNSPTLAGSTGEPGMADRDGSLVDPFADLRKAADEATDPVAKSAARNALVFAEIKARFAQ